MMADLLKKTGNFWTLEKRIHEDKRDCGVRCEMSKSSMFDVLLSLLYEGAITLEDLGDFSDELKKTMKRIYHRENN